MNDSDSPLVWMIGAMVLGGAILGIGKAMWGSLCAALVDHHVLVTPYLLPVPGAGAGLDLPRLAIAAGLFLVLATVTSWATKTASRDSGRRAREGRR